MNDLNKAEVLGEFLSSIKYPVLVEGREDKKILEDLGVSDVVQLHRGHSLRQTVEALGDCDRVVILTDFDRQGKLLRRKLLRLFSLYGVSEDATPREIFSRLRLQHIEDLSGKQYL